LADSGQDINTALERYESNRALLPAGLMLKMSLKTPVRAAVAKVGDRIEARLNYPVKISAKTIAPSGSIVSGHIREFEKLHDPPDTFVVGLEFDTLEWQERSYTFLAELIRMQQLPGLTGGISRYSSRISNSSVGTMYLDTRETFSLITIPGTVTFFLQNASDLPTGFQMIWRTQNLKRR
jgi:hypothetical protein